ncbi:hypothetical protein OIDMADRAFT_21568 [Oidiodendron maius Zn]|uniref:Uncharacterized protein n=1 Tax=Oidiodendron maius (strain Zn) TaxID=913774 RepID=A0A0C3GP08_OIDMZ|nr:hypothetical protein OIDMADRAFT_21568 [Oidiodendron maius Zn]
MSDSAPNACNGRRSLVLSSGSVHRYSDLYERRPVGSVVTGNGRDRDRDTLRHGSCNRKGSGFRKPCTSCFVYKVVYASDCKALGDDRNNYSECSTVG